MPRYSPETIEKVKQIDLLTYLQVNEPQELVKVSPTTYATKSHDSLKISNGKWMWWSRGIGGRNALDYLTKVRELPFLEAVGILANDIRIAPQSTVDNTPKKPIEKELVLPKKAPNNDIVVEYLMKRGINKVVINHFIDKGVIYQSVPMNNVVFVGRDNNGTPKYAAMRGTSEVRYLGDCAGSDKAFSFRQINTHNTNIHIFEGAIDLLSYATLLHEQGSDFTSQSLVSLSGVYNPPKDFDVQKCSLPAAISTALRDNPQITRVYLHLDNDLAGQRNSKIIKALLSDKYKVNEAFVPKGKDVNDYLCLQKDLALTTKKKNERNEVR